MFNELVIKNTPITKNKTILVFMEEASPRAKSHYENAKRFTTKFAVNFDVTVNFIF